ncbi:MAG: hypothetical protein KC619_18575 [Myxococcales bacterium]|nr:hypothetical protein [Myxococcales bacterium]
MKLRLLLALLLAACSPSSPAAPDATTGTDAGPTDAGPSGPDAARPMTDGSVTLPGTDAGPGSADAGGVDGGAVARDAGSACPYFGRPAIDSTTPLPAASGRTESVRAGSFTDEYIYDATGGFKLGVRREWGSSVVFFGQAGSGPGTNGTNTIDANDTGREVQIALYDPDRRLQGCAWNASCGGGGGCPEQIRYLGWNPVQGGNRCNLGSPTDSVTTSAGGLVASTVPLQWNPDWEAHECSSDSCRGSGSRLPSDVRLTQTVRFVAPRIAELHYVIENLSDLDHRPTGQEMPTMYTANGRGGPDLWRLMDPNGTQIPIDTPAGGDGFFYENFTATGPWVSLQNDDLSYGVAILYENGLSQFQGWQLRSLPFNNVRSRIVFGLPPHGTVQARAYLLLGSFATIQAEATSLLATIPPFGWLDGPGETVSTGAVSIHGWALDNRGVVSVEARIDESVTVPLHYGDARPDVCRVWPGYPRCDGVGFSGSYDFGAPTSCPHLVEIIATDGDGNRRTIFERLVTVR